MTTSTTNIESEATNGIMNDENLSFDTNQISSDEQLSQIIDSINLSTACEDTNTDESQTKSSTTTTRTSGQTAIGAKLVKKLETFAATSKEPKPTNSKTSTTTTTAAAAASNATSSTTNNESESRRNITKAAIETRTVTKLVPCLKSYDHLVKVWSHNCSNGRRICPIYEHRTEYYRSEQTVTKEVNATIYHCCLGWTRLIHDYGCPIGKNSFVSDKKY
ncbi:unnamed protein product [Rotaria sp. Silwood2]|nr:unnamed protein product [Rotaria sp. Silwood2]